MVGGNLEIQNLFKMMDKNKAPGLNPGADDCGMRPVLNIGAAGAGWRAGRAVAGALGVMRVPTPQLIASLPLIRKHHPNFFASCLVYPILWAYIRHRHQLTPNCFTLVSFTTSSLGPFQDTNQPAIPAITTPATTTAILLRIPHQYPKPST